MTKPLFIGMPDSYDYVFDGHAGASPSGAERWMHCTASLQASREFLETLTPNQQAEFASGSRAARQGTTAHAVGEVELRVRLGEMTSQEADTTLLELTAMPDVGEEYDDEMAEAVQQYVDLVGQFIDDGRTVLIEQRLSAVVPLTGEYEGQVHVINGSGDTIILPEPTIPVITVIDLKYGEGLYVEAEENLQERIYALGALDKLTDDEGNLTVNVETVDYYIVQPRNGGIKQWFESLDDLLDWRDDVLAPALTSALYDPVDAPSEFKPSDEVCQWCPAKGSCAALASHMRGRGEELFDVVTEAEMKGGEFPETGSLSDEQLGRLLEQINGLMNIREDLKAEAQRRLHRGIEVPGFRLVNYSPPRMWKQGAAEELMDHEKLFKPPTLMTPTQALAVLKDADDEDKALVESLIIKPEIKPLISTGPNDKRKTYEGKPPEQMFSEEKDSE